MTAEAEPLAETAAVQASRSARIAQVVQRELATLECKIAGSDRPLERSKFLSERHDLRQLLRWAMEQGDYRV